MASENDLVLIYFENKPAFFARIEEILPDSKKDWYHVKLLLIKLPLESITWILRSAYIDGDEFTMDGNRIRMEMVVCPDDEKTEEKEQAPNNPEKGEKGKVISLSFGEKRNG